MINFKTTKYISLTTPNNGLHMIYIGYYWAITKEDCILQSRSSYQCNKHKKVIESLLLQYPEGTRVEYIPAMYIPAHPSDYVQ